MRWLCFLVKTLQYGVLQSLSVIWFQKKRIGDLESHHLDSFASSHRKRSRAQVNQDENYDQFSKQLGKIELAIKTLKEVQLDVNELYEEVMKIERFDKVMLASTLDYLVINERLGRAFMAKNTRFRTLLLESFF